MILGDRPRWGWIVVAALAALTACTNGSGAGTPSSFSYAPYTAATTPGADTAAPTQPPTAGGSVDPSVSPTSAVALPELPEAAKRPTREGAEAFFKYFLALYTASYATLNADSLAAISLPTCKFCASAVADIRGARSAGNRLVGGGVTPIVVTAAPGDPKVGVLVNSAIEQSASTTYSPDGRVIASGQAHPSLGVDAAVRWVGDKWVVAVVHVRS